MDKQFIIMEVFLKVFYKITHRMVKVLIDGLMDKFMKVISLKEKFMEMEFQIKKTYKYIKVNSKIIKDKDKEKYILIIKQNIQEILIKTKKWGQVK